MEDPISPTRRPFALALGGIGGYVDGVGFVTLFGLFTAHMSGNVARTGVELGESDASLALTRGIPVIVFVAMSTVGFLVVRRRHARGAWAFRPLLVFEAVLLTAFMVIGTVWRDDHTLLPESGAFYVLATLVVGAMALQTVAVRSVSGVEVHTTFLTGMLSAVAQDIVEWRADGDRSAAARLRLQGGLVVVYLAGAALGALLVDAWGLWCIALALVGLAVVGTIGARQAGPPPVRRTV
jgi:uncharacterized membrane protein YoaK (UPF0700 family)